ncbi:O-antigen ligase family protein [Patescibacteria group bacterium]|nr:O-antigen ligase family protein [Patescibacteria group bacterium]
MKSKLSIFNFQYSNIPKLEIGDWQLEIFPIVWRLAILTLPLQTRWFSEASLANWPWEQGRLSFYVSWFFILATILLARKIKLSKNLPQEKFWKFFIPLILLFLSTLIGARFEADALRAVLQWWLQVSLLALFVYSLVHSGVSKKQVAMWFVISLLPHAALGLRQFVSQQVIGSAWLGIAAQNPQNLGVSVIEAGGLRILRSYGNFPHPNIFGGWLAVGYLVTLWLAGSAKKPLGTITWSIISAVFAAACIFSFSRTAWLAVVIGATIFLFLSIRQKISQGRKFDNLKGVFLALLLSFITIGAIVIPERNLFFSRFNGNARLEAKSMQERATSLQMGLAIFRRNLFFGTGPNAELYDLAKLLPQKISDAPLESPHNVFLLALINFGIIGFLSLVWIFWLCRRFVIRHSSFVIPLVVLALFDHYLWSYWSGQTLSAIGFLLVFLDDEPNGEA